MANFRAAIRIQLRKQILDVQGKTVENALHSLSLNHLTDVHIGKYVELTVAAASKDAALASVGCVQKIDCEPHYGRLSD